MKKTSIVDIAKNRARNFISRKMKSISPAMRSIRRPSITPRSNVDSDEVNKIVHKALSFSNVSA